MKVLVKYILQGSYAYGFVDQLSINCASSTQLTEKFEGNQISTLVNLVLAYSTAQRDSQLQRLYEVIF